jgi:polysaccharide export outer membrane protein
VEGPRDAAVEYTEVSAEDLIPVVTEYTIGPGDLIDLLVADLLAMDQFANYQLPVDTRGYINVPILGEVKVAGKTTAGAREAVIQALLDQGLVVADPVVTVSLANQRQQTFTVVGAVGGPGSYFIPEADYRLLEGLAQAGWFPESAEEVFIIRQIPLSDLTTQGRDVPPTEEAGPQEQGPSDPSGLEELIEGLSDPEGGGAPGAFGAGHRALTRQDQPEPAVDLPGDAAQPGDGDTTWMFLNGEWVEVRRTRPAAGQAGPGGDVAAEQLLTQRVIRIPVEPLLDGDMRYNVVVRPGDVVRVPAVGGGLIFLAGEVARPGAFSLSPRLTLLRAIDSAGGLGGLAIPERTDIWRMLPGDRQAAIRVNLRAIAEGTQPDLYLKPGDRVNVGTNFWAYPLAVFRNGFRATYGFGLLIDRNFGNDIFGPPPTNNNNQFF